MKMFLAVIVALLNFAVFPQINFIKITDSSNPVTTISSGVVFRGASWVDIDNDRDIDLFVCPDKLFRNDGRGNFSIVTNPIGQGQFQNFSGSTWSDFDNDGDIDCFLSRNPSRLYLNDGTGNFSSDITIFDSVQNYPSWASSFGDYNNDGRIDLILAHPAGFLGAPYPNFFFTNQTNGKLKLDTSYYFSKFFAPYTVPYWSDFDQDGDIDLFIASGPGGSPGPDYLYKNLKTESGIDTLVRITDLPFAGNNQDGQCYNFIDYDNDQDLDLLITNWGGAPNRFYNNNNGTYSEISVLFNYNRSSLANSWGDFDNDGDLDLIIANASGGNNGIYSNNGDGTFTTISTSASSISGSNCPTLGDYDNDGDLDLFIMGRTSGIGLFKNEAETNNNKWISISCEGTNSNRSAIGTKVKLKATISGIPVWQYREISAQNTFQGQHDLRVHFGLGNAMKADTIIIIYPGGQEEIFHDIQTDLFYHHLEGSGSFTIITGIGEQKSGLDMVQKYKLYHNYPNPFNPITTIKFFIPSAAKVSLSIFDVLGREVIELVNKEFIEGEHSIDFNAGGLPSGVYIYRITAGDFIHSNAMILLK